MILVQEQPLEVIRRRRADVMHRCLDMGHKSGTRDREAIRRGMVRLRRFLMRDGMRDLASVLTKMLQQQLNEIADRAESGRGRLSIGPFGTKAQIQIGNNQEMWVGILRETLGEEANVRLVNEYLPVVQSVAARAYAQTTILLGEAQTPDAPLKILRRARTLAQQVTQINETTRANLSKLIGAGIDEGLTTSDIARQIRDKIPGISLARIPTIARTEIGRAADEGMKASVIESDVVATVDVIGCTAVEPGIPTFDGRPTCNIVGVPAKRADELIFHVNHTGAIVLGSLVE